MGNGHFLLRLIEIGALLIEGGGRVRLGVEVLLWLLAQEQQELNKIV